MASLPVIAPSPCASCSGPCCVGRNVPVTVFDLLGLIDAFGVPWPELVTLGVAFSNGFRLDPGATRWGFRLRQKRTGRCLFAIGEELLRCGAHAARPSACRLYPFHVAQRTDGVWVMLGNDVACPPDRAAEWSALAAPARVTLELAEHGRHRELIERWEESLDRKRHPDELIDFARRAR